MAIVYKNRVTPMTSHTAPAPYVVEASSEYSVDTAAWKAFDYVSSDPLSRWLVNPFVSGSWISYDFSTQTVISKYTIINATVTNSPKTWTLQGSNDKTNWTSLDSRTGITWSSTAQKQEFEFVNSTGFRYYKLTFTEATDAAMYIREIEFLEAYDFGYVETTTTDFSTGTLTNVTANNNALELSSVSSSNPAITSTAFNTGASGSTGYEWGYQFRTGSLPVVVSELGWYRNTSNTAASLSRQITIWKKSDWSIAARDTVVAPSATLGPHYKTLATPVTLAANTDYVITELWSEYIVGHNSNPVMASGVNSAALTWWRSPSNTGGAPSTSTTTKYSGATFKIQTSSYATSGNRISPPIDVSSLDIVDSIIDWNVNTPTNTSITIQTSVDNGGSWQTATKGSPIPNLTDATISILVKELLSTTNTAVTPQLLDLTVGIKENTVIPVTYREFIEDQIGIRATIQSDLIYLRKRAGELAETVSLDVGVTVTDIEKRIKSDITQLPTTIVVENIKKTYNEQTTRLSFSVAAQKSANVLYEDAISITTAVESQTAYSFTIEDVVPFDVNVVNEMVRSINLEDSTGFRGLAQQVQIFINTDEHSVVFDYGATISRDVKRTKDSIAQLNIAVVDEYVWIDVKEVTFTDEVSFDLSVTSVASLGQTLTGSVSTSLNTSSEVVFKRTVVGNVSAVSNVITDRISKRFTLDEVSTNIASINTETFERTVDSSVEVTPHLESYYTSKRFVDEVAPLKIGLTYYSSAGIRIKWEDTVEINPNTTTENVFKRVREDEASTNVVVSNSEKRARIESDIATSNVIVLSDYIRKRTKDSKVQTNGRITNQQVFKRNVESQTALNRPSVTTSERKRFKFDRQIAFNVLAEQYRTSNQKVYVFTSMRIEERLLNVAIEERALRYQVDENKLRLEIQTD